MITWSSGNRKGSGVTVAQLAAAKRLPAQFLHDLGVTDNSGTVHIPYYGGDGHKELALRLRTALAAKDGSVWPKRAKPVPYGLWRLGDAERTGRLYLVEGETNPWALWYHKLPALGLPGASMTGKLKRDHIDGVDRIYVGHDPDQAGDEFVRGVAGRLKSLGWRGRLYDVRLGGGVKDVADLHVLHADDPAAFGRALSESVTDAAHIEINNGEERPPPQDDKGPAAPADAPTPEAPAFDGPPRPITTSFLHVPALAEAMIPAPLRGWLTDIARRGRSHSNTGRPPPSSASPPWSIRRSGSAPSATTIGWSFPTSGAPPSGRRRFKSRRRSRRRSGRCTAWRSRRRRSTTRPAPTWKRGGWSARRRPRPPRTRWKRRPRTPRRRRTS
jgi:hypothetical protein